MSINFTLKPVGVIHSPFKSIAECPKQGIDTDEIFEIEVFNEYRDCLRGVDEHEHLIVLYWLHQSDRESKLVSKDSGLKGVFATRSPSRPNPVGLSVVKFLDIKGNVLKVKGLDAIEGTPLIDIKPYIMELERRD